MLYSSMQYYMSCMTAYTAQYCILLHATEYCTTVYTVLLQSADVMNCILLYTVLLYILNYLHAVIHLEP